ncbi:DUF4861 family protein [Fulvivirgaceae bacterium BMA12]|uniref:DUF4861 family protein n=1 Tax=Agaribacillus aureus TaxID=3051825 RepID=A0ABT8LKT2_9BACT|nr:DUF4861 family protein [Fulvivirgaceae bacterium BMA12]
MRRYHLALPLLSCFMIQMIACSPTSTTYTIQASNSGDFERKAETIEMPLETFDNFSAEQYHNLAIEDDRGKGIPIQLIDMNQDSVFDRLIFQTDFEPGQTKTFRLTSEKNKGVKVADSIRTFCRIVPERMDDFAWENDKVAFRSYGPKCQELFQAGDPTGLISSGIDCWTKRVAYPIIDKWYREDKNGKSYHEDHGEGLDTYHVGTTRGCGGTALVQANQYILSQNFISWKVLANGPIRSVFELAYAPIVTGNTVVAEKKRITLDLGAHLYHCQVSYTARNPLDTAAAGIALHQGQGKITSNPVEGWLAYWEPLGDSYLGTAILADPNSITNLVASDTLYQDESRNNMWMHIKIEKHGFNYWAGFGWRKSGDFHAAEDWENYLKMESAKKRNPIQVKTFKD